MPGMSTGRDERREVMGFPRMARVVLAMVSGDELGVTVEVVTVPPAETVRRVRAWPMRVAGTVREVVVVPW